MKKVLIVFSMVVMIACIMCASASAASYPPSCDVKEGQKVYFTYDGTYQCAVFDVNRPVSLTYNGHQVVAYSATGSAFYVYTYFPESNRWADGNNFFVNAGEPCTVVNIGWTVYDSNVNIYDTEGNLFFPLPPSLPEVVEELTQEGSQSLGAEVIGTTKTLVPFGVGCLALLTGLVLLSRKLPIFLH